MGFNAEIKYFLMSVFCLGLDPKILLPHGYIGYLQKNKVQCHSVNRPKTVFNTM